MVFPLFGFFVTNAIATAVIGGSGYFGSSGLDLADPEGRFDNPSRYSTEGNDYYVWAPTVKYSPDHNEFDMKGGNDVLNIQFSDYLDMPVRPGWVYGGAGEDTLKLAVDNDRGLILESTSSVNYGPAFTATITAKPDGSTRQETFQIRQFEKFDILSSTRDDRIKTGNYNDIVTSREGDDKIDTMNGDDSISAGEGNDSAAAGSGYDTIYGNGGNDTIYASTAKDTFGNDQSYGGTGNDTIYDRGGADVVYGGRGSDTVVVTGDSGDFFSGGLALSEKRAETIRDRGAVAYNMDIGSKDMLNVELQGHDNPFRMEGWLFDAANGGARTMDKGHGDAFRFTGFEIYQVMGTKQNDRIILGSGNDTAGGWNGADILMGMGGSDTLRGDDGADVLFGGLGADHLVGGAGSDTFVFNTAFGAGEVDRIYDFNVPGDTIQLDNAVFRGLTDGKLAVGAFVKGPAALQADDRIIYNTATGEISFDADGSGSGASILFAKVSTGLSLSASDFLVI